MTSSVFIIGLPILLGGLVNTVLFSFAAISKQRVLRWPATVYVETLRNTPFLATIP
jgi:ABC-type amino acid transport system permease subunit